MKLARVAAAALALATVAPVSAQAPPAPLVREETVQKITEHVWVIPDASVTMVPNVGIIVGAKATLVVDTGLGPENGEAVMRAVAKVSPPGRQLYLVTTHIHPEHDLGASAFPASTQMIRSADQEKEIAEVGLTTAVAFSQRSVVVADLLRGATFRKADISFTGEHSLDLGGVTARILAMGANHTQGDTVVMVSPDRVLFTGDLAMQPLPAFASPRSSLAHWMTSLDRLDALKPLRIVPSHGPMGDAGLIAGYRDYLTTVRDRTAVLKAQGNSVDETVQTLVAELQPRWRDAGRLQGAIRNAYNTQGTAR
jgi:glyoxylase-like metal-dependent hydrolase (beta-lactamase superfamily II)